MAKVSTKTVARMAAVQVLYEFEIHKRASDIEKLIDGSIDRYTSDDFKSIFEIPDDINVKLHKNYLRELVTYTTNNIVQIDDIITAHLAPGWTHEAMHIALTSILRVGIAELLFFPEVPYKVIINEFTTLASEIIKESEIPFVNSLLDNVRMQYRKDEDSDEDTV